MNDSLQPSTPQPGFLRRLLLLLSFTAGIVFWIGVLYRYQTNIPHLLMTIFAVTAVGLAAGLGARLTFYNRKWFVQILCALGALLLGLFALGLLTNWRLGFGPLEFRPGGIDWFEAAQLAGGIVIVLVGLWAWRRPEAEFDSFELRDEPLYSAPAPRRHSRARTRSSQSSRFKLPGVRLPESLTLRFSRNGRLKVRNARASARSTGETEKVVVAKPAKPARSRRKKVRQRKPELQLSVHQEHRCPYCLEEVKRKDPRGVKECAICHTLHHADCWNITGMCQIPHQNSLNL